MPEFAATVERKNRGLDLFILRATNVREVRRSIPKMFRDGDLVQILSVRRYTEKAVESQFDPFGVLAREREDQRARRKIDTAAPPCPKSKISAVQALEELRAAVMSLTGNTDDINRELRAAYRRGFAECRYRVRDLIGRQIAVIENNPG